MSDREYAEELQHYDRDNSESVRIVPFNKWQRRTAADILNTDYPPIEWVVPEIIPEGLTKIDGGPKVGKSWLALHLATAVSTGGCFMDFIDVNQREVLYLALEDAERRLKDRLLKQGGIGNDKLFFETSASWKGGITTLTAYLKEFPETGLVIIDTLFMFSPIQDVNKYSDSYAPISAIQKISTQTGVPIVLIHHTRKGSKNGTGEGWADEGMGSQGINGAVDTIIQLKKPDGKPDGSIRIKGRDVEESCFNVTFDRDLCIWRILDKTDIVSSPRSSAKDEIVDILTKNTQGLSNKELCILTGKSASNISHVMKDLLNELKIVKENDVFKLKVEKPLDKQLSTTIENLKTVENSTNSTNSTVVEKSIPRENSTIQQEEELEIW